MKTLVCKTGVGVSAMLLAMFLLVAGTAATAFAKENISAGQAGDPGDGQDFSSGGGATVPTDGNTGSSSRPEPIRAPLLTGIKIALVPYFDATGLHFLVIVNDGAKVGSAK